MRLLNKALLAAVLSMVIILSGCGKKGETAASIKVDSYNVDDFVTLGQYKNFEIEYEQAGEVTDEDVEMEIASIIDADTVYDPITDRDTVQKGDVVEIDFTGNIGGAPFDGSSATGEYLEVGSETYVAGFEDQLIGKKPATPFDITVKFPEDYYDQEIAGKDAVFNVTIKSINKKTVPTLDDAYVQTKSETSKTVAEYKEEIKNKLRKDNEDMAQEYRKQYVEQTVLENAKFNGFPKGMVEKLTADYKEYLAGMAKEEEKPLADYIKENFEMDEKTFDTELRKDMEETAKVTLVLEAIEKKDNLTMTDNERKVEMTKYATEQGFESLEDMVGMYREEDIKRYVQQLKVINYIVDSSKLVEPKPEPEEAETEEAASSEEASSEAASSAAQ